jgi:spoIIIJ-associated protein
MPWITKEGRTVDEARDAAIAAAGVPFDDLDVEVVNEGAKGLFGLGGEPAVVRVRPKDEATDFRHAFVDDITPSRENDDLGSPRPAAVEPADADADAEPQSDEARAALAEQREEAARLGEEIVRGILERMDLKGEVSRRVTDGTVYIEISGDEMGILIGRSGATLEALQEIVRAGVQRRLKSRQALVVDVESYWERRRRPVREGGDGERQGGGRGGRGRGGRGGRGRRGRGGSPNRQQDR